LSHSKLVKFISKNHPVDERGEKFSIFERVTVKYYLLRLLNPMGSYQIYKFYKKWIKNFQEFERKPEPEK
jgi:hypothetical protein